VNEVHTQPRLRFPRPPRRGLAPATQIAEQEKVPVFTVFSNENLSAIAPEPRQRFVAITS
jgi:hypothetical protein